MVLLTQSSTFIIGDIAKILGFIMNLLFQGLEAVGIPNIGLAIIIFTFVVKFLMLPLTIKQQKFAKMSSVMNPEIQAIQKKYKNKKDNESLMKMNAETKQVYAKYGTSPTGGCLQMLIQLPILFSLYSVIQNIPAYVPSIKQCFLNILQGANGAQGIMDAPGFAETMKNTFSLGFDCVAENINQIVDAMNRFSTEQWETLSSTFSNYSALITQNLDEINHMNNFLGINMSQSPGLVFGLPILIPIFAALSQFVSVKLMSNNNAMDDENPAAASMKMMNMVMPIMSGLLAITLPAGLGLYWIATSVCQIAVQIIVNKHFDKMGVEQIIQENLEKINKKRAKQGLPPQKVATGANTYARSIEKNKERIKNLEEKKAQNDKKMKEILESTNYYKQKNGGKTSSLAEKANMVAKYNEKNQKKQGG